MVTRAIITDGIVTNIVVGGEEGIELAEGTQASIGYTWDGEAFATPVVVLTMEEAKASKLAQIERERDAQRYANVVALGRTWQADKTSQDLLNGAINLASNSLPLPPSWRDVDNSDMPVATLADLLAIAGAIAAQTQLAYSTSWARKAAIEAATTVEAVLAV